MTARSKFAQGDIIKWIDKDPPDYECWPHFDFIARNDQFLILFFHSYPAKQFNQYKVLDLTRNKIIWLDQDMVECKSWMKRTMKVSK